MFAVASLFLGLLFLGCFPLVLLPELLTEGSSTEAARWQLLGLVFASGLLLDYTLVVVIGHLMAATIVGLFIGLGSLGVLVVRHRPRVFGVLRFTPGRLAVFVAAVAILAANILLEPLAAWDARSIWFFHAKIIYFAGGLTSRDDWTLLWDHPHYPNLVPVLAAQIAAFAGFWNEQLPKASLLLLLIPALALTLSLWRGWMSLVVLCLVIWMRTGSGLTNGYMDSHVAIFGLFGVLLLGFWLSSGRVLDLVSGVVFLVVTNCLKNEGSLLLLSTTIGVAVVYIGVARLRMPLFGASWSQKIRLSGLLIVIGGCLIAWPLVRTAWDLPNDMLGPGTPSRMLARLSDVSALKLIVRATLYADGLIQALLCGLAAAVILFRLPRLSRSTRITTILCFAVAVIYLAGIEIVYLATPYDLVWHLYTSADRTTLFPVLLFLVPIVLLFRELAADRTKERAFPSDSRETSERPAAVSIPTTAGVTRAG